jgi:signal transduction histidine kinase
MDVLRLLTRGPLHLSDHDLVWVWTTTVLSAIVFGGYMGIAFNWYFQSRLDRRRSARSLRNLRIIAFGCVTSGFAFWLYDMPAGIWQLYDLLLFMVGCYVWSIVFRSRGPSLINALEEKAWHYVEISELLPHIVWTADARGDVDYSNRRWSQYSSARTWLDVIHPEDKNAILASWKIAIQARRPFEQEVRLQGLSEYRTFLVKAVPIMHGSAVKWLGACADIEAQKQLASEKENQIRQKTFFLNALSHDLRAPLNNIALNGHLLKMTADQPVDMEAVDMIIENASAAGELLSKLLEYARAGQEYNLTERVDVNAMLQQVGRRFLPIASQKGLYLRVIEAPQAVCVCDRSKLERILSNLLDNAVKHTNKGGVQLSAHCGENHIGVRISDTGTGIPAEHVPFLFDEFFQVNNHERDRSKGFGLGLAICRFLARQVGGDVRLLDTGVGGSTFEITLQRESAGGGRRPQRQESDRPDSAPLELCTA